MIKYFSDTPSLESRALQIWQILIGFAYSRKITTYSEIAEILEYDGAGVLNRQLGHIMFYCSQHGLPPLTVLVVNSDSGLPGQGFETDGDLHAGREDVFNYPWFSVFPPSTNDFRLAWNAADKK